MSILIKMKKISKQNFAIIVCHSNFFEKIGFYNSKPNHMGIKLVSVDIDRLSFWLIKGATCEMAVYKILKFYKMWGYMYESKFNQK